MKRDLGYMLVCLLFGGLWLWDRVGQLPIDPVNAGRGLVLTEPLRTGGDNSSRIFYPPGHYPILRMHNGGVHPVRSLLNVTRHLDFGDYVWDAGGIRAGQVWVRIDLAGQLLSVFRGGDEIGTAVIIYGTKAMPTPVGVFPVLEKSAHYYSKSYGVPMPYALRLTADGVALQASSVRERSATHGCIGMPLEFARLLFNEISQGDEVEIIGDSPT